MTADSAYLASLLGQIDGPVLLAGHSYGGAVITNAAASAPNVLGLVFVAAFAPDEGETPGRGEPGSKDSVLNAALVQYNYPAGPAGETAVEFGINPALLREAFAADLPEEQTALMAATQRPIAAAAFSDASGPPAWKKLPSWAVVATGDKAAGADVVRSMAQRAGADIVEVEGSHVIMISQPQAVTDHILKAARAVEQTPGDQHEPGDEASPFGALKQAEAGDLSVGYAEAGPADGPAVLLLHGWPYDIHSFAEVTPVLASAGYRVIVPYLRGYGTTRFLFRDGTTERPASPPWRPTPSRSWTLSASERRSSAGSTGERGRPTSSPPCGPDRCRAMVSVSGYLIGSQAAGQAPLPPAAELSWWYQFYFATERGRAGYGTYRREFARLIWQHRLTEVGLRRRDVRPERRVLRQPRSRRHRDPQLPLAARPGRGRGTITTSWNSGSPAAPPSPSQRSPSKATPTARLIPNPAPTRRNSRASTRTGPSPAASGTTCPRRPRRPSPRPSSTSPAFDPSSGRRTCLPKTSLSARSRR